MDFKNFLNTPVFLGLVRQMLTLIGTASGVGAYVTDNEYGTLASAVIVIVGLICSAYANNRHAATKAALVDDGKAVALVKGMTPKLVDVRYQEEAGRVAKAGSFTL